VLTERLGRTGPARPGMPADEMERAGADDGSSVPSFAVIDQSSAGHPPDPGVNLELDQGPGEDQRQLESAGNRRANVVAVGQIARDGVLTASTVAQTSGVRMLLAGGPVKVRTSSCSASAITTAAVLAGA
jgi:hypothetical protein